MVSFQAKDIALLNRVIISLHTNYTLYVLFQGIFQSFDISTIHDIHFLQDIKHQMKKLHINRR